MWLFSCGPLCRISLGYHGRPFGGFITFIVFIALIAMGVVIFGKIAVKIAVLRQGHAKIVETFHLNAEFTPVAVRARRVQGRCFPTVHPFPRTVGIRGDIRGSGWTSWKI